MLLCFAFLTKLMMGEEVLSAASTELLATSLRTSSCKHVYWALHDVPSYVSSPSTCDVELKDHNIVVHRLDST